MTKEEIIKDQFPNDEFLQSSVLQIVDKCTAELEMTVGTLHTFSNEQAACIEKLKAENDELKQRLEQEKCNNIHLQTIAELEKENDSLKETIRKGTSCGDWNDAVHACQIYLRQEQLQECINQLAKARKLIQKMKCCGNCKYNSYWGNEMHCNYGLKEALQKDKLVECKNMNKWEIKK